MKTSGLAGHGRTGVHVADVCLLEPAVQLEHVLVGSLGKLVGHLHGEIEFLLERHGGVDGAFENGRIGSRTFATSHATRFQIENHRAMERGRETDDRAR
jgi:hypothetical protein